MNYPPRAVQGFFKKAELELMIQRRTSRKPLASAPVNTQIVERYYQTRAIRRISEAFEKDHDRKALVVMATPKDEIDINTYGLFDLERGVPTDAYGLENAVKDGFLVPAKAVSVPLKFPREGITYDELTEEEQEQWDALEWEEDGGRPDRSRGSSTTPWPTRRT